MAGALGDEGRQVPVNQDDKAARAVLDSTIADPLPVAGRPEDGRPKQAPEIDARGLAWESIIAFEGHWRKSPFLTENISF